MPTTASWYHANVKSISRGNNKTYVGAVAYIIGERIYDEENKRTCYRGHPGEVLSWGIVSPECAPAYFSDKDQIRRITNEIQASETRSNAQFSNHWDIALWRHTTPEQAEALMNRIATRYMDRYGTLVVYAVHAPSGEGSDDNHHGHLIPNMRRITEDGIGEKVREITYGKTRNQETEWVRGMIAEELNAFLASVNSDERVTHLSYRERGIVKEPTVHLGNNAWQAEKRGIATDPGNKNRQAKKDNEAYEAEQEKLKQTSGRLEADIINLMEERRKRIPMAEIDDQADFQLEAQKQKIRIAEEAKERAEEFVRQLHADQEREKKEERERKVSDATRVKDGDITDAQSRYMQAAGDYYDIRDPYRSLTKVVTAEHAAFKQQQEDLRKQEAAERDPEKRQLLGLRRQIEAADYMTITSERLAGMSYVITGNRGPDSQHAKDIESARQWRARGADLRNQRGGIQQEIAEREFEKFSEKRKEFERTGTYSDLKKEPERDSRRERKDAGIEVTDAKAAKMARAQAHFERNQEAGRDRGQERSRGGRSR